MRLGVQESSSSTWATGIFNLKFNITVTVTVYSLHAYVGTLNDSDVIPQPNLKVCSLPVRASTSTRIKITIRADVEKRTLALLGSSKLQLYSRLESKVFYLLVHLARYYY